MFEKLAIDGGRPIRSQAFPAWPIYGAREEQLLLEVLHSGKWGSQAGNKVETFEKEFSSLQQARYGVCMVTGTAALEVGLRALGVGLGDHVITTPYTFVATINAILMTGAVPVFVDIDANTLTIDTAQIESAITPRTKAILPVHMAGYPANMDAICDIANRRGLMVLEDACQAWGSEWRGRRVGALGNLGAFSFQLSKNITAGEGGILVTNDEILADFCWSYRNVGRRQGGQWYEHVRMGANYRLTEWQGAILLAQLERFPQHMRQRAQNAAYLTERLAAIEGIRPVRRDPRVTAHSNHLFIFRYDATAFGGMSRERFLAALAAEGVPCGSGYQPVNHSPAVKDGLHNLAKVLTDVPRPGDCPVAERICAYEAVWLTQNMLLGTTADMDSIVEAILKIQHAAHA